MRTTILHNQYVTLYYHQDKKIVHHIYKLGIGGGHLKEALTTGTDLLIKHGAEKWLSDNRAIEGHTAEEETWIDNHWLPRTIEAGWKYWALIVPESIAARMNMAHYIRVFADKGVTVRVFVDVDEAMTWLVEVDNADEQVELPLS